MITKEYLQQELRRRIDGIKPGIETTTDNIIAEMKSILVLVDALQDRVKDYDDALKRAKDFKNGIVQFALDPGESIVHYIFPELRESEDERIRKAIIKSIEEDSSVYEQEVSKEQMLSYLKKQKEQNHYWKPTETDVALFNKAVITNNALTPAERAQLDIIRSKFGYCRAANCSGIVQEEQKPAEEIKDRRQISFMIEDAWRCGVIEGRKQVIDNPEEYGLQKQAEWSEEDEKTLNLLIETLDDNSHYFPFKETKMKMIHWLKSLRPHPSWKPSEEQMEGLKFFLEFHRSQRNAGTVNWREYDAIESLYEQLKKL